MDSQQPPLVMKRGKEYWDAVRATAEKVQKWPEWKKGKPAKEASNG